MLFWKGVVMFVSIPGVPPEQRYIFTVIYSSNFYINKDLFKTLSDVMYSINRGK